MIGLCPCCKPAWARIPLRVEKVAAAFFFARQMPAMRYHCGHECAAANDDAP
jgi:hypothetical protein